MCFDEYHSISGVVISTITVLTFIYRVLSLSRCIWYVDTLLRYFINNNIFLQALQFLFVLPIFSLLNHTRLKIKIYLIMVSHVLRKDPFTTGTKSSDHLNVRGVVYG